MNAGASCSAAQLDAHCTPAPHTHSHREQALHCVCVCKVRYFVDKLEANWIFSPWHSTWFSSMLFAALDTGNTYATHARARARTHTARVKAPLRLQLLRTVAIEHRIRIENEAESRETGGRKFKIFFKINSQQQQQHTTSMLTRESEATSNRTVARACRSMFEPCATCVLQWSKTSVRIACFFY